MTIEKLDLNELDAFRSLIRIFNDVFEKDNAIPDEQHLRKVLSNPDLMVLVVKLNGRVVGGLTIYVLHGYYSTQPTAYIYDVGIETAFQGRGYGKALINEACRICREGGFESAYVEAEQEDQEAVQFYRKTRFTSEINAIHFNYSFEGTVL